MSFRPAVTELLLRWGQAVAIEYQVVATGHQMLYIGHLVDTMEYYAVAMEDQIAVIKHQMVAMWLGDISLVAPIET